MKSYLRNTLVLAALLFSFQLCASDAEAQGDMSSTLNPVGSGARAMGMGGAFIGVADDATAASWNPAGLVLLEKPEISAVYSYFNREASYSSPVHPETATDSTIDADGLNFASMVFPFVFLDRNMVFSLSYQRLFELNKDVTYTMNTQMLDEPFTNSVNFQQDGYLYAVSPAYAIQITPALYIGATLNIWDNILGSNGWNSSYSRTLSGSIMGMPLEIELDWKEDISFEGFNSHLGFLWSIDGSWTLGGVYKTEFDADLEKHTSFRQFPSPAVNFTQNLTMRMPPSYGLGLAFRHSDSLTIALDVYRTEWSRHVMKDELTGEETNPLDGLPISEGRLEDTTQVRLGGEYLFISDKYTVPVRLGVFYDPDPARGSPDDMYGFTIGTGYSRGKMVLDIAYQLRTGDNVTGDMTSVEGSSADITQHTVLFSAILYLEDMYSFFKGKR